MISVSGLSKSYLKDGRTIEVLRDVNLDIRSGEMIIIRGRSGSGKSTLLNVLAGLTQPSTGTVEIAGTRVDTLSSTAATAFRAQRIGFVFQMFHLIPYLSLLDNVLLPMLTMSVADALRERAQKLLTEFDLADRATHLPGELSAGERQRTAIARAILREPDLLLADEAVGNLDPANAAVILSCLRRYHEQGKTVILVTHHELAALNSVNVRELQLQDGRL
ncbi:MAG: ABC transporter ATP-binding protein [Planctomycetota bacterium]